MADPQTLSGLDGTQSVSALGLRWAALRGMLNSPLIMAEEQRSLRDELVRELSTIERDFSTLQSRNATEVSAKLDIAKSVLREKVQDEHSWLVELIESIQSDLNAVAPGNAKSSGTVSRPITNLTRNHQRQDENATQAAPSESETPSAA